MSMRGAGNYDTRGPSAASQIITLERMLRESEDRCERLRKALRDVVRDADRFEDEGSLNCVHPTTIEAARAAIGAGRKG